MLSKSRGKSTIMDMRPSNEQRAIEVEMGLPDMERVFHKLPEGQLKEKIRYLILTGRRVAHDIELSGVWPL